MVRPVDWAVPGKAQAACGLQQAGLFGQPGAQAQRETWASSTQGQETKVKVVAGFWGCRRPLSWLLVPGDLSGGVAGRCFLPLLGGSGSRRQGWSGKEL